MNVRLVQFNLGIGAGGTAEGIASQVVPLIRAQPGCDRCAFFGDEESGDYGIVVLWASKQDADNAAAVVAPVLSQMLQTAGARGDSKRLFDVYEPRI